MLEATTSLVSPGHVEGMVAAAQSQQALLEAGVGVSVQRGEVEMMVMDSLDPTLMQMKTEVAAGQQDMSYLLSDCFCLFF